MFYSVNWAIFIIALCSILTIYLCCLPVFISERYRFFPPPAVGTWQYHLFWTLFRLFIVCLVIISIIDFNGVSSGSLFVKYLAGLPLLIVGIGSAFYLSYFSLGQKNSYGGSEGLQTSGFYRWSRNPIYVVSIIGMVGWGLFVNSYFVWVLLVLWALMYIVAPFIEEPWLEQKYGDAFTEYKLHAPRFFGLPK